MTPEDSALQNVAAWFVVGYFLLLIIHIFYEAHRD